LAEESGIEGFSRSTWWSNFSSNFDAHGFVFGTGSLGPLGGLLNSRLRTEVQRKSVILRTDAVVWTEIEVIIASVFHLEIVEGGKSDIGPSSNVLAL